MKGIKSIKNLLSKQIDYYPERMYFKKKDKQNIIIHHYCPHTFNAGDHFVIQSIRNHLLKEIPNAVFIPKAIASNRGWGKPIGLKGENIRLSNEYADGVIVGGSDQYNNWSPRISRNEINQLTPPLFLIGLGVSSKDLDSEPYISEKKYMEDIYATNRKAKLSSVRDHITKKFLEKLGFFDAIDTGCPALYLFDNPFTIRDSKYVALTFPYPLIHKKSENKKYVIIKETILKTIHYLKSKNLIPVITCHDDRDVFVAQYEFPQERIFFSNYTNHYFDFYNNCLMVIGSRLHATILNTSLGVPNININVDLRGQGFAESFDMSEWHIDYNDNHLIDKLFFGIDLILSHELTVFKNLYNKKAKKYKVFKNFIHKTAEIIKQEKIE